MLRKLILSSLILSACLIHSAANAAGPTEMLPPANAVPGWKQVGTTRTYNRDNLFQLIDGEAEAVNAYAFKQEAHGEYGTGARPAITVDVYELADPLNAYGLFGSDRISGTPIAIGAEGVR